MEFFQEILEETMEYMSQEGYDELVAELEHLEKVELPAVRDAIAEARDKGPSTLSCISTRAT